MGWAYFNPTHMTRLGPLKKEVVGMAIGSA